VRLSLRASASATIVGFRILWWAADLQRKSAAPWPDISADFSELAKDNDIVPFTVRKLPLNFTLSHLGALLYFTLRVPFPSNSERMIYRRKM
jgi:hypothetical protein